MRGDFEPERWNVVFNREARRGWGSLVPGRYKHVRAYAFLPALQLWLFYDVKFSGTSLFVIPHGAEAMEAIYSFIGPPGVSDIVSMPRLPQRKRLFPSGVLCTAALRHLLNLPGGALLPDSFYRDCLAHGGQPFEADDGRVDELRNATGGHGANAADANTAAA